MGAAHSRNTVTVTWDYTSLDSQIVNELRDTFDDLGYVNVKQRDCGKVKNSVSGQIRSTLWQDIHGSILRHIPEKYGALGADLKCSVGK